MSANKGEIQPLETSRAQRTLARRAAESRATVPYLELAAEVDIGPCLQLAQARSYSLTALVVKACALGLREVPRANGAYRDGDYELYSRVNVGLAVASPDAIVIPTLFDADRATLAALTETIADRDQRAASGKLSPPELAGATFTVWSAGGDSIASTSPLIVPPQAAALSFGSVRATPVVRDEAVVAGQSLTLTLACDHRILYGEPAAALLGAIRRRLHDADLGRGCAS